MRYAYLTFAIFIISALMFVPSVAQDDNETCLSCHDDPELTTTRDSVEISIYVTQNALDGSVHEGLSCIDCHADLDGFDDYPHPKRLGKASCSNCHDDVWEVFAASAHGEALDNPKAATCTSCHGTHSILASRDSLSLSSHYNLPKTCSSCHRELTLKKDPDIHVVDAYARYVRGVHGRRVAKGYEDAPSCEDCHGIHDLYKASDPRSKVYKTSVPETCARCHSDIYAQYENGIHGKALAAGILDSPNCSDCHGEHEILAIGDPDSPVNLANIADYVCGRCHNDLQLVKKYGMKNGQFTTYQDSYHGLAVHRGSTKAASCASCHRAHDILPTTNPASTVHPDHVTDTCRKCHPNATEAFAASYTHQAIELTENRLNAIIRQIYILLIVVVIGGMVIHTLIIYIRFVVEKRQRMRSVPTVQRFTKNMVFQHMLLIISFSVLVITGFALRYPDTWWVSVLNSFGMYENVRSLIHRIAAGILVYAALHHILFLIISRRGRQELKAIAPTVQDVSEAKTNILYHLGLSGKKADFGRYDYTEKAEYWALIWGTVVMAITGFILWFPTFFTSFLPPWIVKVAETIHLYEAWLATLAIVLYHFFFVIFHPERYPMSLTWLNGKITERELRHHHPKWYRSMNRPAEEEDA